jgi:hypothetical protein
MKSLKGLNRLMPLKAKLDLQVKQASSDARLMSLAKRIFVYVKAHRAMNAKNVLETNLPEVTLPTLEQMKNHNQKLNKEVK